MSYGKALLKLVRDESGQNLIEYALVAALIALGGGCVNEGSGNYDQHHAGKRRHSSYKRCLIFGQLRRVPHASSCRPSRQPRSSSRYPRVSTTTALTHSKGSERDRSVFLPGPDSKGRARSQRRPESNAPHRSKT
jgi:hypothetical protein